jgi:sterol desaturase/sphingolipid hydroxylase (fatty acid hydroxylase superfamily)
MARRSTVQQIPAPRVIHYVDPSTPVIPAELTYPLHPAQLAARRQQDQVAYLRWKARQQEINERERKFRRFWLGFGAIVALAVLTGVVLLGWWLWQALASLSLGALAIPVVVVLVISAAVGGHHCITTVTHRH